MRLAFFQPDIAQNLGAGVRLAACLGVGLDVIEPCGFAISDRAVRRAVMDYADLADVRRHDAWEAFLNDGTPGRLLLLTSRGAEVYSDFTYFKDDTLLLGRESAGAPDDVHAAAAARLRIPMADGARSLNVVTAAAMVLGEALRQTGGFPGIPLLSR